ncbi:MAG: amidohydrolase [bacterium]|nr:amidohydrolase [bacterium]
MLIKNKVIIENGIEARRYIHENPEISYEEYNTYKYLLDKIENIENIEIDNSLKPTLLATLPLNRHGITVAFRADIDALELTEETELPFKSKNSGVMHACMHDMHAATLLMLLNHVADQRKSIKNIKKIKFIFQSAEENPMRGGGAIHVINSGFLDDVDYFFANHFDSSSPIDEIVSTTQPMTSNHDVFDIYLEGVGGHGSRPEQTCDVIPVASEIILALQTLVSRKTDPFHPLVLSITDIHAGEGTYNIIPGKLHMRGTLRTMYKADRENSHIEIKKMLSHIGSAHNIKAKYVPTFGYPSVVNHLDCVEIIKKSIPDKLKFKDRIFGMAGEDVAFIIQKTKKSRGALFLTGVADENIPGSSFPLHNPKLEGNEQAMENALSVFLNILNMIDTV